MKQIILSITFLLVAVSLFSQETFKLGIVKGKHVTYQVRESKDILKPWLVRNMHNPDTVLKRIPWRRGITAQELDIKMQIVEIIHKYLSQEELEILRNADEIWSLILRVDKDNHKLLQVTCFLFENRYYYGLHYLTPEQRERGVYPDSYDDFWLNLDPDKLSEIEKDIVEQVELPKRMHKSYIEDDIWIVMNSRDVVNVERVKEKRQKAIAAWKKNDGVNKKIEICGPPREL